MQYNIMSLFIFLITFVIIELIISSLWVKFYFTKGIPLYIKSFSIINDNKFIIENLENLKISNIYKEYVYKKISENQIGFREKIIDIIIFGFTNIMHGVLKLNHNKNEIILIGYCNYSVIVFLIFILYLSSIIFIVISIIFLLLFYIIQKNSYDKISKYFIGQ